MRYTDEELQSLRDEEGCSDCLGISTLKCCVPFVTELLSARKVIAAARHIGCGLPCHFWGSKDCSPLCDERHICDALADYERNHD